MIAEFNEMPVTIRLTINEDYMRSETIELTYNNIFEFKGALNMFCYTFDIAKLQFNMSAVEWYDISMNWDDCDKVFEVNTIDELNEFIKAYLDEDEGHY